MKDKNIYSGVLLNANAIYVFKKVHFLLGETMKKNHLAVVDSHKIQDGLNGILIFVKVFDFVFT